MALWLRLVTVLLGLGGCTAIEKAYLPSAEVDDDRWTRSGEGGPVDHRAWAGFLDRYVAADAQGVHLVDYGAVTASDRQALQAYIADLERVPVTTLKPQVQLAYWINLYNAVTVRTVLEAYPVKSIRSIGLAGPWGRDLVMVEGQSLSLNEIEHKIVRPVFQDPRVHYALNCAAYQCPNLARQPYRGADLDEQLEAAAEAYVNDPRGLTVKPDGDLVLSKIYTWFQRDFGGSEAAVLEHLSQYAEGALFERIDAEPKIDGYVYDWSLNDQARAESGRS